MATLNFAASVDKWAKQSVARMEAVFKTAAEITIEEVSVRTPVDTGFLRASLTVSLSGMLPIRANAKGTKPKGHARGTAIYRPRLTRLSSTGLSWATRSTLRSSPPMPRMSNTAPGAGQGMGWCV
jgi:hypothetical protein